MLKLIEMRPPRIATGLLILTVGIWHLSPPGTLLHLHYKLIAVICLAAGLVVMLWGWALFKKARTAVCVTSEPSVLITSGIYRYTRNPMYLGMLFILGGSSFFMGTIPSMFAPFAFFLIIDKLFIPYEEKKMTAGFGAEYLDYMKNTRRWF